MPIMAPSQNSASAAAVNVLSNFASVIDMQPEDDMDACHERFSPHPQAVV
jgi:hypothetical protein